MAFEIHLDNADDVTPAVIARAIDCVREENPGVTIESIYFDDDGLIIERFGLPSYFIDFPVQRIGD